VTSRKKLSGLLVLSPSDFVSSQPNSNENEVENNNVWKKIPPLVVGRNSKQNERVTFEIAKPHHLWFHVQVKSRE
jgi:predicted ribosome quality control (RQC) complex YloA/Tae2 family protein